MKKLLSNLIVLTALVGLSCSCAMAKEYTDMPKDHWAYKDIQQLTDFGVVVGYPDGSYRPDIKVTRAEFATMAIKALGQQNAKITEIAKFTHFDENHWAWEMVQRGVMFDLLKGNPDGSFNPEGSVSRGQTIAVIVNALTTQELSKTKAEEILENSYTDYKELPYWLIIASGKAEVLGMIVPSPGAPGKLNADMPANRAEVASFLMRMLEQAKLNPNEKLKKVMEPRKGEGIVIQDASVQNYMATIPAGSIIPVIVCNDQISSQTAQVGDKFLSKLPKNLITKEKYLLIVENSPITGSVTDVKIGRPFFRDGKLCMDTKSIVTEKNPDGATFAGIVLEDTQLKAFWKTFFQRLFVGSKVIYKNGQVVNVQLTKPIRIDLTNGWIVE